jgi:hypothetical protein
MGRGASDPASSADGGAERHGARRTAKPARPWGPAVNKTVRGALLEHGLIATPRDAVIEALASLDVSSPQLAQKIRQELGSELTRVLAADEELTRKAYALPGKGVPEHVDAEVAKTMREDAKEVLDDSIAVRRAYARMADAIPDLSQRFRYLAAVDPLTAAAEIQAVRNRLDDTWRYAFDERQMLEDFPTEDRGRAREEIAALVDRHRQARADVESWLDSLSRSSPQELVRATSEQGDQRTGAVADARNEIVNRLREVRSMLIGEQMSRLRDQYYALIRSENVNDSVLYNADHVFRAADNDAYPRDDIYEPTFAAQMDALRAKNARMAEYIKQTPH